MLFDFIKRFWLVNGVLPFFPPISGGSATSVPAIQNSIRVRKSASADMTRTFGTPTNNTNWTLWFSIKKTQNAGAVQALAYVAGYTELAFNSSEGLGVWSAGVATQSTAVFRAPSAFMHVHFKADGTNITAYVNNVQVAQRAVGTAWNTASAVHRLFSSGGSEFFDGVCAQAGFVDGQGLNPSAVAQNDSAYGNEWKPKTNAQIRTAVSNGGARSGWGNNGFLLDFSDTTNTTTLGHDHSQSDSDTSGNNWTLNNFSLTGTSYDALIDSPCNAASGTRPVGNYPTLTPLQPSSISNSPALSQANLRETGAAANWHGTYLSQALPTSGKWYFEAINGVTTNGSNTCTTFGIATEGTALTATHYTKAGLWGWHFQDTRYLCNNGSNTTNASALSAGTVVQIAVDIDNQKVYLGIGNVWYSAVNATTSAPDAGGTQTFSLDASGKFVVVGGYNTSGYLDFNAGQYPFTYTPPTGYKALCTANLATPSISISTNGFVQRYQTYTSIASDLASDRTGWSNWIEMWFKDSSADNDNKFRFSDDSGNQMVLDAEAKSAWVAPAAGSWFGCAIRADASYGVVTGTYTGDNTSNRNITHSLSGVPEAAFVKDESTGSWYVYHKSYTGATYFQKLETIDAAESNTNSPWGTGSWLSSTFMVTNNATNNLNANGVTYRYILFKSIPGYLSVGSWGGNSSTDGTLIDMGFRPAFVYHRNRTSSTSTRARFTTSKYQTYNPMPEYAFANDYSTGNTWNSSFLSDIVATGLKRRSNVAQDGDNITGQSYWYIAFADAAINYSNAR